LVLKQITMPVARARKIDYAQELNEAQYKAVTTTDGPLLIVAGAGTGKTRTLVYRLARLIETGVRPESILLLTFTRRAATSMLAREAAPADERCRRVSGGTLHSFAHAVLRKHSESPVVQRALTALDSGVTEELIDLLLRLREALEASTELRQRLSDQYRYIMVDEYKETIRLQAQIVRLMTATHDNVAVVGDEAQSIYSFRGASFKNMLEFPELFPAAQLIKLEENFRSTQPILDVANSIIAEASEGYRKQLFSREAEGEMPLLVSTQDE